MNPAQKVKKKLANVVSEYLIERYGTADQWPQEILSVWAQLDEALAKDWTRAPAAFQTQPWPKEKGE